MAQIPTPPLEAPDSWSLKDLRRLLDILLERYLCLLDRYQMLQAELGRQFSSGFLSLAHANYCSPPGRRYGEDYYDERMKATRRLSLQPPLLSIPRADVTVGSHESRTYLNTFRIHYASTVPEVDRGRSQTEAGKGSGMNIGNTKHLASSSDNGVANSASTLLPLETGDEPPSTQPKKKPVRGGDPLSWYGILVPQSLRNAQKSFTTAIEGFPELVSVVHEMRILEREISGFRERLGCD